jgi:hypothetical protein
MALDMQILWITKADCFNPHRYITSLGGMNADGSRWTLTESAAIVGIDAGRWNFYVSTGGRTVAVIVDVSARGHRFLKTAADGHRPDNLLVLPECP